MNSEPPPPHTLPDPHLLAAALEGLGEGITLADASGRIIYSNPAADRILGVPSTNALPEKWASHFGVFVPGTNVPFPTDAYPLVRALRGEEADEVEMFIRNPAVPQGVLIAATGRPVRDTGETIVGAAVVFRDVTWIRKTEDELRQTVTGLREMEAAKSELLGFLVHDMKGPLSAILIRTELLLTEDSLGRPGARAGLQDVLEAARALQGMVLNMLDVQAGEDGHLEPECDPVRARDLFEPSVHTARARGADVEVAVDGEPVVEGDSMLLRRVVGNLVDNSIRYGPPGGTIRLEASNSGRGTVLLRVCDQGPGIPEELRERIFDKYARLERTVGRRREGSLGLGLRFCKVAVEAHGGRIWVEDNDPEGAIFCVEVPAVEVPAE